MVPQKVLDKLSLGINRCNSPALVMVPRVMRLVEELRGIVVGIVDVVVESLGGGYNGVM